MAPTRVPETLQFIDSLPSQIRVRNSIHTVEWYESAGRGQRNAVLYYHTPSGRFKWSQHVTIGQGDLASDIVERAKRNRSEHF